MNRCKRCTELHRKLQKAEGLVIQLQRKLTTATAGVNTWKSPERQAEYAERTRMMHALDKEEARSKEDNHEEARSKEDNHEEARSKEDNHEEA